MEKISYRLKNDTGKYAVQISRYIETYPEHDRVSEDSTTLQYLRSDNLEELTRACDILFEEFQILECEREDDSPWRGKVIYSTPLMARADELKKEANAKSKAIEEKIITKNREILSKLPEYQVMVEFNSGEYKYLIAHHYKLKSNVERRERVHVTYSFSNDPEKTEKDFISPTTFYPSNFITKNGRILKKQLGRHLSSYGFSQEDIIKVEKIILDLDKKSISLKQMIV